MNKSALLTAHGLIHGDRQHAYGHPLDDFAKTAAMWTARLRGRGLLAPGVELQPEDVAWMMVDVKWSRECNGHGDDNLIDAAGYIGTLDLIHQERQRRAAAEVKGAKP